MDRELRSTVLRASALNNMSYFKILTGKPTGKRPLGRPRHTWENNIRMEVKKMVISTRNWVDLVQDWDYWIVVVNAELNLRVT